MGLSIDRKGEALIQVFSDEKFDVVGVTRSCCLQVDISAHLSRSSSNSVDLYT